MDVKEKLLKDKRFYINPLDFERISKNKIKKYELVEMPVGKIKRYLNGRIFDLYETDAYKLLDKPTDPNVQKKYDEYCKNYCYEYENRSKENYKKLINHFENVDYDPKKGVIVVDQLNVIADGQHRSCIILKKYGPKKIIKVLKITYSHIGLKTYFRNYLFMIKSTINGKKI